MPANNVVGALRDRLGGQLRFVNDSNVERHQVVRHILGDLQRAGSPADAVLVRSLKVDQIFDVDVPPAIIKLNGDFAALYADLALDKLRVR